MGDCGLHADVFLGKINKGGFTVSKPKYYNTHKYKVFSGNFSSVS